MERDFKGVFIPKDIWFINELNVLEKIILSEVRAFKGNCWASNAHFAELCQVSPNRISHIIMGLVAKKYIASTITYKPNSKQIDQRFLKITHLPIVESNNTPIVESNNTYCRKQQRPIVKDNNTPIVKSNKENNTVLNNTMKNTIEEEREERNFSNSLPPTEFEKEDFEILKAENERLKAQLKEDEKVARSVLQHQTPQPIGEVEKEKKVAAKKEKGLSKIIDQIPSDYEAVWVKWIKNRYEQHKFEYKSAATEKLAFDELYGATLSNKDSVLALKIVEQSMVAGWKSLLALKNQSNHNQNKQYHVSDTNTLTKPTDYSKPRPKQHF